MTPQAAKALAEVMLAYAEGRQIQLKQLNADPDAWQDCSNPKFMPDFLYRIKPETKAGWINIYKSKEDTSEIGNLHPTKEIAITQRDSSRECIACIKIHYTPGEGL